MRWVAILLILAFTGAAYAQIAGVGGGNNAIGPAFRKSTDDFGMGLAGGWGGSTGPPPSCSNKLDFSSACNSQYVSILGIM